MTSEEILGLAVKIERQAAEIYRLLHSRFREDEMAGFLWYSMALEEDDHADFIEAEIRMLKTVPKAFGEVTADVEPLLSSLKMMQDMAVHLRSNPITLETAVCLALRIEEDMVEKKYGELIEIAAPSLRKIFEDLTKMNSHVDMLNTYAKKLGLKCQ